jgi:hypothetical protein
LGVEGTAERQAIATGISLFSWRHFDVMSRINRSTEDSSSSSSVISARPGVRYLSLLAGYEVNIQTSSPVDFRERTGDLLDGAEAAATPSIESPAAEHDCSSSSWKSSVHRATVVIFV